MCNSEKETKVILFDSLEEAENWKIAIDQQAKSNQVKKLFDSPKKETKKE